MLQHCSVKMMVPFSRFRKIGSLANMERRERNQRDATEFYEAIMGALRLKNACCKVSIFSFLECVSCEEKKGHLAASFVCHVKVKPVYSKDLIHTALTEKFSTNSALINIELTFANHCDASSVWEPSLIHRCPAALIFKLRRSTGQENILQSHVIPDKQLDLTSYALHKNSNQIAYRLGALICHHAQKIQDGHYTTHIVMGNGLIKTFDDDRQPQVIKINTLFGLETFLSSTSMLFYFLEPEKGRISECPRPHYNHHQNRDW